MIPKKIHYCWFGGSPLPEIAKKCINSWKKFCPDYEIIFWNESNCNLDINPFVSQAARNQKWAFVSDYYRLKIVEEYGGIYLDIDVELIKSLDELLEFDGFMGFELSKEHYISTGLGFGAVAGHEIIKKLMESYEKNPFIKTDGSFDMTPCPQRDTKVLINLGLKQNNCNQHIDNFQFFSSEYFSPIGFLGEKKFTHNTYSIHHFNASWLSDSERKLLTFRRNLKDKMGNKIGGVVYNVLLPFQIIKFYGFFYFLRKIFLKIKNKLKMVN
ncbi:glycosyl transferase [Acinetobacter sp. GC2]|uniref:glycosyltransferase family 32 protein n=1 Tax=Acinetobacter lwoffii TaxID=28090 RepID=UPI0013E0C7D2|nr:glycosyltransferase [Acinetobacter lwoffii]NGP43345.1 glycosyl transferase [Acinetobacter lwoffii]